MMQQNVSFLRACASVFRPLLTSSDFPPAPSERDPRTWVKVELPPSTPAREVVLSDLAVEAADFVDRDASPECERFGLLALALDAAVARDRDGLAVIEDIEATRRGNGRSHVLEWAAEQLWNDAIRLRQAADLVRALVPHEAAIRALLAAPPPAGQ